MSTPQSVIEPEHHTAVMAEADVIIVGGSRTGVVAAIAAARNGADVLLLERSARVGGQYLGPIEGMRNGAIRVVAGIPAELLGRVALQGGAIETTRLHALGTWDGQPMPDCIYDLSVMPYDRQVLAWVAFEMLEEAGVRVLLHTQAVGAVSEDRTVLGVIVEGPGGRRALLGRVVIDASGNGSILRWGGAELVTGRQVDERLQPNSLCAFVGGVAYGAPGSERNSVRQTLQAAVDRGELPPFGGPWLVPDVRGGRLRHDEIVLHLSRVWGDATDTEELTHAEMEALKQVRAFVGFFRDNVPGYRNCYLIDVVDRVAVRESRRLLGQYVLTGEDVLACRQFEDSVGRGCHPIDIHAGEEGSTAQALTWLPPGSHYGIPYRCLLPRTVEGLLASGRCVSTDRRAFASYRVHGSLMASGQAAGTAAALAAARGIHPTQLDGREVRTLLESQGALC